MALVIADRVQETTTTTGTGTVTLLGAVSGFQSFAAIGNGNSTYYNISGGLEWEVGIGTYTSSGTTLSRTTVLASSNSGSLVNFSAGTKNVFVTYPAERSINLDSTGNLAQAVTAGLGTGRLPVEQFYRLDSTLAGANATGAQSFLGVGVTLAGSTVYQFEAVIAMNKTAGTTSYVMNAVFGGTATLNNINYSLSVTADTTSYLPVSGATGSYQLYVQAANTAIRPSSSAAALYIQYVFKGTVSVNAGGTFIPQYSLSAAPGGAFTVQGGAYFKISPLAASGANVNIGNWA
jgi:hypothetical protein